MQRRSPPKHRHDGTSPLPLGMDWSPPPKKWNGRHTVWPHDPRTGWSFCVIIPSWVVLPKSKDSEPVVFYRVQIGIQSPEGITTTRAVLRRFNDFMKLFSDLKMAFPRKNIPTAPPKGLLRLKTRALLEERRCSLEEWLTKLLSDIDLSRSIAVASFLELEAAARSSFQEASQQSPEASLSGDSSNPSLRMPPNASSSIVAGGSSVASDYGSDTAYETSDLGTPRLAREESYEIGFEELTLDESLSSPIEKLVKYGMTNIDEGLFMGQTILDQLEGLPRHKAHSRHVNNVIGKDTYNGNVSKVSFSSRNGMELFSEADPGRVFTHARKLSNESVGSDGSSLRGSELSNSGVPNSSGDGSPDLLGADISSSMEIQSNSELHFAGDGQVMLPSDLRPKMNRVLLTLQQRLVTTRTDMEDLIARLNQEMAVKDYLATKVKDLEEELESTKQKNKENLRQAILVERERLTQMQWDMEELKRKSLEMELKLKSKEDGKSSTELKLEFDPEKDIALQELDATRKQLENLSKQYEELEAKSKADIKFLAKEFKSLKSSHAELKRELSQALEEKSVVEKQLQEERELSQCDKHVHEKLIHDCRILCNQLQEFNTNLCSENNENSTAGSSSLKNLDLLTASNEHIGSLLTEAKKLAEDGETAACDGELRKVLVDIFTSNAELRKRVISIVQHSLQTGVASENGESPANKNDDVER